MSYDIITSELAGFPTARIDVDGDRPRLLFVHGAFVTHHCFAGWMAELAALGYSSIAASRRGRMGRGPARAAGLRIADYVDDTLRVIDALDETPIVIGHSLGGLIAQRIAELGRSRASVLLAPAPAAMLSAQPMALPALLPMMPRILMGKPIRPSSFTSQSIALNCIAPEHRPQIHGNMVHESGLAYREMIFGRVRVDPAKVKSPTLVVGGLQDRIISRALLTFTAQRYGAELKLYDTHGHWLLEEPGWQAVAADVAAWLERRAVH